MMAEFATSIFALGFVAALCVIALQAVALRALLRERDRSVGVLREALYLVNGKVAPPEGPRPPAPPRPPRMPDPCERTAFTAPGLPYDMTPVAEIVEEVTTMFKQEAEESA
jgi:hypothetical protein